MNLARSICAALCLATAVLTALAVPAGAQDKTADSPLPPTQWGYHAPATKYGYDPAAARKLSEWNYVPAVSDAYDAASRDIRARVEKLIAELAAKR